MFKKIKTHHTGRIKPMAPIAHRAIPACTVHFGSSTPPHNIVGKLSCAVDGACHNVEQPYNTIRTKQPEKKVKGK